MRIARNVMLFVLLTAGASGTAWGEGNCCTIVRNPVLAQGGASYGQLVVEYPAATEVLFPNNLPNNVSYEMGALHRGLARAQGSRRLAALVPPGTYRLAFSGWSGSIHLPGVEVRAQHDTRVHVGLLHAPGIDLRALPPDDLHAVRDGDALRDQDLMA
jgi:hypothetical protein